MKKLLVIESSPRGEQSVSKQLVRELVERLKAGHPKSLVKSRDLAAMPLPHFGAKAIEASVLPPDTLTAAQKIALDASDQVIGEVFWADAIIIGVPRWNLSIPSALKAWIDHLVRIGKTLGVVPDGYEGLITGKRMIVVTASGGVFSQGPFKPYDFLEPYLRSIFGLLGITDVTFIHAEGLDRGGLREDSLLQARREIQAIAP